MTHKLPYRTTVGTTLNTQNSNKWGKRADQHTFLAGRSIIEIFYIYNPRSKIIEDFSLYHYLDILWNLELLLTVIVRHFSLLLFTKLLQIGCSFFLFFHFFMPIYIYICYLYQLNEPSLEASNIISPFAFKKKKNLSQSLISPQKSFIVLVKIILVLFSRIWMSVFWNIIQVIF